jgi:hypothetical protein
VDGVDGDLEAGHEDLESGAEVMVDAALSAPSRDGVEDVGKTGRCDGDVTARLGEEADTGGALGKAA